MKNITKFYLFGTVPDGGESSQILFVIRTFCLVCAGLTAETVQRCFTSDKLEMHIKQGIQKVFLQRFRIADLKREQVWCSPLRRVVTTGGRWSSRWSSHHFSSGFFWRTPWGWAQCFLDLTWQILMITFGLKHSVCAFGGSCWSSPAAWCVLCCHCSPCLI